MAHESADDGIRLPARGRNRFGPTSFSTVLKFEPRGPELVLCIVQVAPTEGKLLAELTPAEFLRLAAPGEGIDFNDRESDKWLCLPPTSCRRAVRWLKERGFVLPAALGPRSRLSGLAERLSLS
jgi:hypothetical protein